MAEPKISGPNLKATSLRLWNMKLKSLFKEYSQGYLQNLKILEQCGQFLEYSLWNVWILQPANYLILLANCPVEMTRNC